MDLDLREKAKTMGSPMNKAIFVAILRITPILAIAQNPPKSVHSTGY
jgi:hypothetical protein